MSVKISQLPSASEVLGSDVAPSVQDGTTKKFSMTTLANYLLNTFNSLSLGGTARTVKSAIDAIYTSLSSLLAKVGNVTMGTTATTITGAIAEHEGDITTINASLSRANAIKNGTYTITNMTCYGFITSSGTAVHVSMPMIVSSEVTQISVSSLAVSLRHVGGGYIGNAGPFNALPYLSGIELFAWQPILGFSITKSDGWGVANNTPVVGQVTISFTAS